MVATLICGKQFSYNVNLWPNTKVSLNENGVWMFSSKETFFLLNSIDPFTWKEKQNLQFFH